MTLKPSHIFVSVDADVTADAALAQHLVDVACVWARAFGARLTLCHVALPVVTSSSPPTDPFGQAYRAMTDVLEARNAAAGRVLQELKERAGAQACPADVMLVTQAGRIPELIVEAAHAAQADLILVASHGRRGLQRVVLGSVAERVAHLSTLPVLLLPPERGGASGQPVEEKAHAHPQR